MIKPAIIIQWFRRDLRLEDNLSIQLALSMAAKTGAKVLPIFIFDTDILDKLPNKQDTRVTFIWLQVEQLVQSLKSNALQFQVHIGKPLEVFKQLNQAYHIKAIVSSEDYEPFAIKRDTEISTYCSSNAIHFQQVTDQVIFRPGQVVKNDGKPYTVFTPFAAKWKATWATLCSNRQPVNYSEEQIKACFMPLIEDLQMPSLASIGFKASTLDWPEVNTAPSFIQAYANQRNFPSLAGTSGISLNLRFGVVSIRQIVQLALENSEVWLNELIWREFFMQILFHYPQVVTNSFRPVYDKIEWRNDEKEFERWCQGQTGFPIVDAGMRQLNQTGFMHNRVRMVVASFLCKHLLIDWRWGEAYFAEKLLDYELASNNGNWQWAAGCGCDAAPYFRIFNPYEQQKKFDPQFMYIKKWVPEFNTPLYPPPMVDHALARIRALATYSAAVK